MKELLEAYSISDILLFIVLLAGAIRWVVTLWDWGNARLKQKYQKDFQDEKSDGDISTKLTEISAQLNTIHNAHKEDQRIISERIDQLNDTINTLMASDRDDIKSWITEKHHYFCYEKGVIDDFSLDCIEKRYGHYVEEGGNSYVATLMREIRALPKVSVIQNWDEHEHDFENHENK